MEWNGMNVSISENDEIMTLMIGKQRFKVSILSGQITLYTNTNQPNKTHNKTEGNQRR